MRTFVRKSDFAFLLHANEMLDMELVGDDAMLVCSKKATTLWFTTSAYEAALRYYYLFWKKLPSNACA